jgi:hypothetical protein
MIIKTKKDFFLPCLDARGEELCFISNAAFDLRVRCDVSGKLNLDENWKGWEVFRFTEVGNEELIISSWIHDAKVLCSSPEGHVSTTENKQGNWGNWEKWTVSKSANGVHIQSVAHSGRYLCFDGERLHTTSQTDATGADWCLETANSNIFYLSCPRQNKRLSSTKEGDVSSSEKREAWEEWKLERTDDGDFAIISREHGGHLMLQSGGTITTTTDTPPETLWKLEESPRGGVFISSVAHDTLQLQCDENGNIGTIANSFGNNEAWHLESRMPRAISGGKLGTIAAVGAAAVALTVAAPFMFMGAVSAIGFGAEGILGGSIAAAMMSAGGGTIAAGGTVATLQSIGAAGLGAAGTAAAMGSGAAVGGLAVGATARSVNGSTSDVGTTAQQDANENRCRPLAAWRHW